MRVACLWFPRIGTLLALRQHPELAGRQVVLLSAGAVPSVTGCTPEATARGVRCGMPATQARSLAPHAAFLSDNAGACLDMLERAAHVIRLRASERIEVGGRDHLFVDVEGTGLDEPALARRIQGLAQAWTGLEVRAGVASTRRTALEAARAARRFPLVCAETSDGGPAVGPFRDQMITASRPFESGASGAEVRAGLVKLVARMQVVLAARGESYREVTVTIGGADGDLPVTMRPPRPLHDAAAVVDLLRRRVEPEAFACATSLTVTLGRLGPDVRVGTHEARTTPAAPRQAAPVPALPRAS